MIEHVFTRVFCWLGKSWESLAQPVMEVVSKGWAICIRHLEKSSGAVRLSLSRQGVELAPRQGIFLPPVPSVKPDTLELYAESGCLVTYLQTDRSESWSHGATDQWRMPAFWVKISKSARLASGALAYEHGAPGELDNFVEQIRLGRLAGLYPPETFQQARILLRQTKESG